VAGCQAQQQSVATTTSLPAARGEAMPLPRMQKADAPPVVPVGLLNTQPEDGSGRTVATVLATVNTVPILEQEVKGMAPSSSPVDLRRVLDVLIERELLWQDAHNRFKSGPGARFMDKLIEESGNAFDKQFVRATRTRNNIKTDEEFKDWLRANG